MAKKSLYILSSALLLSCSASRYLAELPYHYPTDAFYKAVLAPKKTNK
jgi:NLP/P60 protein